MKLEKQTLNFGKKIIKEQVLSIQKVQKSLNLNFKLVAERLVISNIIFVKK